MVALDVQIDCIRGLVVAGRIGQLREQCLQRVNAQCVDVVVAGIQVEVLDLVQVDDAVAVGVRNHRVRLHNEVQAAVRIQGTGRHIAVHITENQLVEQIAGDILDADFLTVGEAVAVGIRQIRIGVDDLAVCNRHTADLKEIRQTVAVGIGRDVVLVADIDREEVLNELCSGIRIEILTAGSACHFLQNGLVCSRGQADRVDADALGRCLVGQGVIEVCRRDVVAACVSRLAVRQEENDVAGISRSCRQAVDGLAECVIVVGHAACIHRLDCSLQSCLVGGQRLLDGCVGREGNQRSEVAGAHDIDKAVCCILAVHTRIGGRHTAGAVNRNGRIDGAAERRIEILRPGGVPLSAVHDQVLAEVVHGRGDRTGSRIGHGVHLLEALLLFIVPHHLEIVKGCAADLCSIDCKGDRCLVKIGVRGDLIRLTDQTGDIAAHPVLVHDAVHIGGGVDVLGAVEGNRDGVDCIIGICGIKDCALVKALCTVEDAVAVGIRSQRIEAECHFVAVAEAVRIGIDNQRVRAVEVHLVAVGQAVGIGIAVARIGVVRVLIEIAQTVCILVAVCIGEVRIEGVGTGRIGAERLDLEAVRQTVAVGIRVLRIRADLAFRTVTQTVAVRVGELIPVNGIAAQRKHIQIIQIDSHLSQRAVGNRRRAVHLCDEVEVDRGICRNHGIVDALHLVSAVAEIGDIGSPGIREGSDREAGIKGQLPHLNRLIRGIGQADGTAEAAAPVFILLKRCSEAVSLFHSVHTKIILRRNLGAVTDHVAEGDGRIRRNVGVVARIADVPERIVRHNTVCAVNILHFAVRIEIQHPVLDGLVTGVGDRQGDDIRVAPRIRHTVIHGVAVKRERSAVPACCEDRKRRDVGSNCDARKHCEYLFDTVHDFRTPFSINF